MKDSVVFLIIPHDRKFSRRDDTAASVSETGPLARPPGPVFLSGLRAVWWRLFHSRDVQDLSPHDVSDHTFTSASAVLFAGDQTV